MTYQPLTDREWRDLEPLFPSPLRRGRGKPHAPWRQVVNSILVVFTEGGKWHVIPKSPEFATKSVAHRWFALWEKNNFLGALLETYRNVTGQNICLATPRRRKRLKKGTDLIQRPSDELMVGLASAGSFA